MSWNKYRVVAKVIDPDCMAEPDEIAEMFEDIGATVERDGDGFVVTYEAANPCNQGAINDW